MSWFSELADMYDQNENIVGIAKNVRYGKSFEKEVTLLPISHTTVNIPIQISIDENGNFIEAQAIDKEEQKTIIPVTVDSASRSSGISPMPVDDKLKYIARDYSKWSKKEKDKDYYDAYLKQLRGFVDYLKDNGSEIGKKSISAIYKYVSTQDVLKNLSDFGLFGKVDSAYSMSKTWKGKEEKPLVYKYATGSPLESYVRFKVIFDEFTAVKERWNNKEIFNDWINYYNTVLSKIDSGVDYVTGKNTILTEKHPKGILPMANNAKLISANDSSNYTFRGRFLNSAEAVGLSYEKSQKAQLALKWLIEKQGFAIDSREYLAWGMQEEDFSVANPSQNFLLQMAFEKEMPKNNHTTNKALEEIIYNRLVLGVEKDAGQLSDHVYVMELDAPVPGRMDIVYYQSMNVKQYLDKLSNWYVKTSISTNSKHLASLKLIGYLAYGEHANAGLMKNVVSELSRVILGNQIVPDELLLAIFRKAVRPLNFDKSVVSTGKSFKKYLTWNNTLITAARLYKTHYPDYGVYLDESNDDPAYLFGRLLALAQILEYETYSDKEKKEKHTNAERFMAQMVERPLETWKNLYIKLQPYFAKNVYGHFIDYKMNQVLEKLAFDQNTEVKLNRSLSNNGKFLIGFVQQRDDWYSKKEDGHKTDTVENQISFQLNQKSNDRSYLFGRLLAIADMVEDQVLRLKASEDSKAIRLTNAKKRLSSFVIRPLETWKSIYALVQPYFEKNKYGKKADSIICEIINKLNLDTQINKALSGSFLLGYAQQKIYGFRSVDKSDSKLDEKIVDTNYLFGRLLATADIIEQNVLNKHKINRPTNAKKYIAAFSVRPKATWKTIYKRVQPYIEKSYYGKDGQKLIQEISSSLNLDSETYRPLSGLFLVGYAQQRLMWHQLRNTKEKKEK